jgi:asparagine synthase (glutamine-hydrolysing)
MCGILGAIGKRNPKFSTDDIAEVIGHRGPDSIGMETIDLGGTPVLVGHSRLAIVDLSAAGAQPMYSHDRRWLVVYNGEIYNHQALRDELTTTVSWALGHGKPCRSTGGLGFREDCAQAQRHFRFRRL